MNSRTTKRFRILRDELPTSVQRQARHSWRLFRENSRHPGLHFKQVHSSPELWSARVGIGYRAVGVIEENTIIWFWIGSHADYDTLLRTL